MKIVSFLLLILTVSGPSSGGKLRTDLFVSSETLNQEISYSVYLPEGYDTSTRDYPILYLLHGFTDDHTGWVQYGELENIANREIDKEEVTPMVIVTPDAGLSWYINNHDGSLPFEDFFIQEFIPEIENRYRIKSEKQFRAIAGLSMGGHGALIYALKYPELFTAVAPLSASIRTNEEFMALPEEQWTRMFAIPFGENPPNKRITKHLKENTVLNIIESKSTEALSQLDYYVDCGDDDHLILCNMRLHGSLIKKGVAHEFRVRDGAHEWHYWRSALPEVLSFVSGKFHK